MTDPTPECALCLTSADTCATTEEVDGIESIVHDFCAAYCRALDRGAPLTYGAAAQSISDGAPDAPPDSPRFAAYVERLGANYPGIGRIVHRLLSPARRGP